MRRGLLRFFVLGAALTIAFTSWLLRGRGGELAAICFLAVAAILFVGLGKALWTGRVAMLFNSSVVVRRREEPAPYWMVLGVIAAFIALSLFSAVTIHL
jgi:hypothetical protein